MKFNIHSTSFIKEYIVYAAWPALFFTVVMLVLALIGSLHIGYGTMLIGGVLGMILGFVMAAVSTSKVTMIQGISFVGISLFTLLMTLFIYPSIEEKKGVKSVLVYKTGTQHHMDVVTVDDEKVTFFFPESEAQRISDINDSSKVFVTLEYLYDRSTVISKHYSTKKSILEKNVLNSF